MPELKLLDPGKSKQTEQIPDVDWDLMGRSLVAYALRLSRAYQWPTTKSFDHLPGGKSAEDIAALVIEKVLTGKRRWDPSRGELKPFLYSVLRSEMQHLSESWAARHEKVTAIHEKMDALNQNELDPEASLLASEKEMESKERLDALFEATRHELELQAVLRVIMQGCEPKPRFLADALGIATTEINKRLRRLRQYALQINQEKEQNIVSAQGLMTNRV